jgi:predicted enzyme related to lactoylglutathione lyase
MDAPTDTLSTVSGRLALVILWASDLERSVRFYRDLVGIPLTLGDNGKPGDPWIGGPHHEYSWREGAYLHFSIFPARNGVNTSGAHIGLHVVDLAAAHTRLVHGGAEVLHEPRVEPWGTSARYSDPDGNTLELTQPQRRS